MDLQNLPIGTWILAKLYEVDKPIKRKPLLKNLCQASFATMNEANEFSQTIDKLTKAHLIEETYVDRGYEITEQGIIEFRQSFGNPFQKIKDNIGYMPESNKHRFQRIISAIKNSSDLPSTAARFCIENTPFVLEFLKFAASELGQHRIHIN